MKRAREGWVVVDLGFGDAGKGTVTDFLVRDRGATLVVRGNGGGQAGHNVVTPDGRHHTFSQFGAGTLAGPSVQTHLGPAFVLHPGGMWVEARVLAQKGAADVVARTTVDARARVTTPVQQAAGRLRELLRGTAAHGTTGIGVGETVADALAGHDDALCAGDLGDARRVRACVERQRERKLSELAALGLDADVDPAFAREAACLSDLSLADRVVDGWRPLTSGLSVLDPDASAARIAEHPVVVAEGAQGVLLDEVWGFHPHTTWSDCTFAPGVALLGDRPTVRLGIVRAYATRHGAGPFPSARAAWKARLPEPHNPDDGWQGAFRVGPLDGVLLRYAAAVCGGIDGLAVTCLDHLAYLDAVEVVDGHVVDGSRVDRWAPGSPSELAHREALGAQLGRAAPVVQVAADGDAVVAFAAAAAGTVPWLVSRGPTAADKAWTSGSAPARAAGRQ